MSRFLAFIYLIVPSTCMVAFGVRNFTMLSKVTLVHQGGYPRCANDNFGQEQ